MSHVKRQPWMSCRQAAIRLGVSHQTISRMVEDGHLRRTWITLKVWGITVESVQAYEIELERLNNAEKTRPIVRSHRAVCAGL